MSDDHVEFLKEYNAWIEQRKRASRDLSPEAFIVDRAKDEALDRLINIEEALDGFEWIREDESDSDFQYRLEELVQEVIAIVKDE